LINFINTSILFGLLGVAIPLLIHLLARQRVKKIYFSSLIFIQKIQKQHFRRFQIRQILLLLLRCLAILFLVLAFARPTLRTGKLFKRSGVSCVIALDHSMSMVRGEIWTRALSAANQVADLLEPGDLAALISDPFRSDSLIDRQAANLEKRIARTSPCFFSLSIDDLLDKASRLLSVADINREIFLITDMQKTAIPGSPDSVSISRNIDHCYVIPVTDEVPNIALSAGGIENQIINPQGELRVFGQLRNFFSQPAASILVRLSVNGSWVAQKVVDLPANSSTRVSFSVIPEKKGWIDGKLQLDEDGFDADNTWFFTALVPPRYQILLIGSSPEDVKPVRLALSPGRAFSSFEITEAEPGKDWTRQHADAIFLINSPTLDEYQIQALDRFMETGGGLILFPGPESDIRQINDRLLRLAGLSLGELKTGEGIDSYRSFGRIDFEHDLFNRVFDRNKESLPSPRFYKSFNVVESGTARSVIRFKDGSPFLLVHADDHHKLILTTGGIHASWTDFQYNAFFAPFLYRLTLFAADRARTQAVFYCGSRLEFDLPAVSLEKARFFVQTPDDERTELLPYSGRGTIRGFFSRTELPGFYRLYQTDSLLSVTAVNMNPDESDFSVMDTGAFKEQHLKLPVTFIEPGESFVRSVQMTRCGREIAWELFFAALCMLILEMAVARVRRGDNLSGSLTEHD
jgi:hypothetical protein